MPWETDFMLSRRRILTGSASVILALAATGGTLSQPYVDAAAFGFGGETGEDQSPALQAAIDAAAALRQPLYLGPGLYDVHDIAIRRPVSILGSGDTVLRLGRGSAIFRLENCENVVLDGLRFEAGGSAESESALVDIVNARRVAIRNCILTHLAGTGIRAHAMQGAIEHCDLFDIGDTAIFSTDSGGIDLVGNSIARCGNGAIRIWRNSAGSDGSRVIGNRISAIDWKSGGNGQNGNGINVFRAADVSVAGNHLVGCAFSAIRLNASNNCQVSDNYCYDSGEVSIFSEFGFSGSIIRNNFIEGGAAGISMTNFDHGGQRAICQGNIVRNLKDRSLTNPDTVPYGIAAEADAVLTGNIVEAVPGAGIQVGWGPYLRDVLVSNNLVRDCALGIVVSVAPGAGHALVSGNIVSASRRHAIVGARWDEIVSTDLPADAGAYANIRVEGNSTL